MISKRGKGVFAAVRVEDSTGKGRRKERGARGTTPARREGSPLEDRMWGQKRRDAVRDVSVREKGVRRQRKRGKVLSFSGGRKSFL